MRARPIPVLLFAAALLWLPASPVGARADTWKAGAARVKITPEQPMWMSGYSSRSRPAEATMLDLWAKALVLEDSAGQRIVLVTMDLIGIHRQESLAICRKLGQLYGLERRQIMLSTSHTHCGPVVGRNLLAMYFLDERQRMQVEQYAAWLEDPLLGVVGEALENLEPCTISWGVGQATFAVNRRNNREADVPQLREQGRLVGPVDYDVPVLAVRNLEGKLSAVVFGYACHATVMDFYQWSGDYPGYAQLHLERDDPGLVALFWAGCGGDQNPLPRRRPELADQYGQRLAKAVQRVLSGVMAPVTGELGARYAELELPLAEVPSREQLVQELASSNAYEVQRARLLLDELDAGQALAAHYPYPIQVWQLGPHLTWVALGGEAVVDYALRLKRELGAAVWVTAYANDVMAYIPSRRVLLEGGYEGGGAMVYYGLPSPWSPEIEELIIRRVKEAAMD